MVSGSTDETAQAEAHSMINPDAIIRSMKWHPYRLFPRIVADSTPATKS
jgi:hypothetical protein